MNALSLAQLIFGLIGQGPTIIKDVQDAISQHWGKDHVVQAQLGLAALSKVVDDVAVGMQNGSVTTTPSASMGVAPTA